MTITILVIKVTSERIETGNVNNQDDRLIILNRNGDNCHTARLRCIAHLYMNLYKKSQVKGICTSRCLLMGCLKKDIDD